MPGLKSAQDNPAKSQPAQSPHRRDAAVNNKSGIQAAGNVVGQMCFQYMVKYGLKAFKLAFIPGF